MNILVYLILTLCLLERLILTAVNIFPNCEHLYSVVIDGGSSGTRLNIFKFDCDLKNPTLNQTFTFKSKIALSSFSKFREDWSLMRVMLNNLTESATFVIPDECVKNTPLYVQVTAGIRQIEQRMGSRILTNIRNILWKSKFKFTNNYVDTLTPTSEGQLAWISINYLMDNLRNTGETKDTVGILDLGGGSTQIAFATENPELTKVTAPIRIFGREYFIYSRGYDYFGINEARLKYFNAQNSCQSNCKEKMFRSQCLHPNVSSKFMLGNRTLLIGGQIIRNGKRFCYCFMKGLQFTKSATQIRRFFDTKPFVAFSAYFFILKSAGDIFKINPEGFHYTNIRDIIIRAMEICEQPRVPSKLSRFGHFLCMDLSYLVALLHNGYGFEWYDELLSSMKIKGINLSWALGYAISKF